MTTETPSTVVHKQQQQQEQTVSTAAGTALQVQHMQQQAAQLSLQQQQQTPSLMQNSTSSSEIVYGGAPSATGSDPELSHVMSDKVQMVASAIYKEFEVMIQKYGQDSVKDLMPLVISILESLDLSYLEKEEQLVDFEMLKEENEQLMNQYEREKQMRKNQDQKCLEMEESLIDHNRDLEGKIESLESIVRMLELKAKNASDHANRLEEREADQKLEFERLHERYNELLRTHIDHVERTKFLMGSDMFDMAQSLGGGGPGTNVGLRNASAVANSNRGFGGGVMASSATLANIDSTSNSDLSGHGSGHPTALPAAPTGVRGIADLISAVNMTQSTHVGVNLASHISSERDWQDEFGQNQTADEILATPRGRNSDAPTVTGVGSGSLSEQNKQIEETTVEGSASGPSTTPGPTNLEGISPSQVASETGFSVQHQKQQRQKRRQKNISENDDSSETISLGADLTGMGREVENLIRENTELLETKNALNIVKNDLIARLDQLASEQEVFREEVHSLGLVKAKLTDRVFELEAEARSLKERLATAGEEPLDPEADLPMGQRKRFTRNEMTRVLSERNQYKERLLELQEALKYTELQRARKAREEQQQKQRNTTSRSGIWDFFSSLFGDGSGTSSSSSTTTAATNAAGTVNKQQRLNPSKQRKGSAPGPQVSMEMASVPHHRNADLDIDLVQERRRAERRRQYRAVSQHMKRDDEHRAQAYGWSWFTQPTDATTMSTAASHTNTSSQASKKHPDLNAIFDSTADALSATTPVPVCCRPLLDQQPSLKIWCAASVSLHGGRSKRDGRFIFVDSMPSCCCSLGAMNDTVVSPLPSTGVAQPSTSAPAPIPTPAVPDSINPTSVGITPSDCNARCRRNHFWPSLYESSSLIWVGSANERRSVVTILDANNANHVVDCFPVGGQSHLLTIGAVPGVHPHDPTVPSQLLSSSLVSGTAIAETSLPSSSLSSTLSSAMAIPSTSASGPHETRDDSIRFGWWSSLCSPGGYLPTEALNRDALETNARCVSSSNSSGKNSASNNEPAELIVERETFGAVHFVRLRRITSATEKKADSSKSGSQIEHDDDVGNEGEDSSYFSSPTFYSCPLTSENGVDDDDSKNVTPAEALSGYFFIPRRRSRDFSLNTNKSLSGYDDEDDTIPFGDIATPGPGLTTLPAPDRVCPTPSTTSNAGLSIQIRTALDKYGQLVASDLLLSSQQRSQQTSGAAARATNGTGVNTTLPTMWMGMENNFLYVHSAVVGWRRPLFRAQLPDAVLHILHHQGRVFCALANGCIAVFHRDSDGHWSTAGYHLVQLSGSGSSSVCHLTVVNVPSPQSHSSKQMIWAAYRNCITVLDPDTLRVQCVFPVHPRRDSQVRQLVPVGAGVWISIRLDSTIRLFHTGTHQHLQDLDVDLFVTKMLGTSKLDFVHLRITSLSTLNNRLWVGTGSGVIVSVPFTFAYPRIFFASANASYEQQKTDQQQKKRFLRSSGSSERPGMGGGPTPGALVRVPDTISRQQQQSELIASVPQCSLAHAQLSFHGHKDAVRFLVPVLADGFSSIPTEAPAGSTMRTLMVSGGDGYIDFRLVLGEDGACDDPAEREPGCSSGTAAGGSVGGALPVRDMSHLVVWETECPSVV